MVTTNIGRIFLKVYKEKIEKNIMQKISLMKSFIH